MGNPKHRKSKSKSRMGRASKHLEVPNMIVCPNCGEHCRSHTVCSACGYYKNREIIDKAH